VTTATRKRTGADIFANVAPVNRIAQRRKCVVCEMSALAGDLCENCRRDLPGLLASLNGQQDTIIARMTQQRIDLELHIGCATQAERTRYAKMCEARNLAEQLADIGMTDRLRDFNRRYEVTQALQDGLGAIVRADARVSDQWRDVEALNSLQRKIEAVELAIEGLKESE
jgi:hypothetical protein